MKIELPKSELKNDDSIKKEETLKTHDEKYSENNIIYSDFDVYDMILQNFLHKLSHLPYEDYKEVEFMKSLLERA